MPQKTSASQHSAVAANASLGMICTNTHLYSPDAIYLRLQTDMYVDECGTTGVADWAPGRMLGTPTGVVASVAPESITVHTWIHINLST